ncbi:hypothetical protein LZP73_14770 [Shewanella sp. AS16]|uniref:hypothetical protein n=1 Tax=Shewanella sp. AS16 TaxID=2907625 RepID=UPI001F2A6086|nr:hypothetical protein [Shewanella sp. AS16]MCE9687449.1 hypothetical protein [Shewanella sp. AS16]
MISLKSFTKEHWIGIAGIIVGLLLAFLVPYWQTYWVETPQLSIEINSISREISSEAGITSQDYPELGVLDTRSFGSSSGTFFRLLGEDGSFARRIESGRKDLVSPETLRERLEYTKEELKSLPDRIDSAKTKLEEVKQITPTSLTLQKIARLNAPLLDEVGEDEFDASVFKQKRENVDQNIIYFKNIIDTFVKRYESRLSSTEERYSELQTNLPIAERKIELLIAELKRNKSFFRVSAILANSGKSSISIKKPALLRVYIGTGNYVDLKMELEKYQESAEVSAHGTRIASFKSKEISTIPDDDQNLINTYWGQSVHAILFIEDILSYINTSNPIAFSEGLYQKIIYDRLEGEASDKKYFSDQY